MFIQVHARKMPMIINIDQIISIEKRVSDISERTFCAINFTDGKNIVTDETYEECIKQIRLAR